MDFLQVCLAVMFLSCGLLCGAEEDKDYYSLFMDGKKAGRAVRSRILREGKVTSTEEVTITISRGGTPITVTTTESCVETADGKPISFESIQELSFMMMKVSGKINEAGMIDLTISSTAGEQTNSVPWPEGAIMAEGLRLLQKERGLEKGTTYNIKIFSPSVLQALDTEVIVGEKKKVDLLGRVVTLTEVKTKVNIPMAGEIESIEYVDDELNAQKVITSVAGIRVEMVACEKEVALSEAEVYEIVGRMFIKSPVEIDVSKATSITYYLRAVEDANSPSAALESDKKIVLDSIPTTDNQTAEAGEGGGLILTVKPIEAPDGAKFPYEGEDEKLLEALKPTRFVQSDNKKIIELAKQAVGDTKDAAEAVEEIEEFVANYIENSNLSVGYASAVEVAESRQGDCSEFAVLTAALCRAVGIPARVAVGEAYIQQWRGLKNVFGGHAWVEAYVGGKWIGLDAAFRSAGLGGYDAGHITLAVGNGDPEDFFALIGSVGQFEIEKLQVETSR